VTYTLQSSGNNSSGRFASAVDATGPGQTSGQLCYDADFTPYGQEMSHTEHLQTTACPPNYKFTGYERDTETGLDYAFARYYSSSLGRFLSTDPLGGSIGSLQSHNAYAYVVNNPSNFVDPTGMNLVAPGQCDMSHGLCGGFALGLQIFPIFGLYNGEEEPPLLGFLLDFSFGYVGPTGSGGGGKSSLPTFSNSSYDDCAKKAFGATDGNVPGSDRSIPGFDAALDVLQASLLVGADPTTVAITMAFESNSNLQVSTNLNSNGSIDIGPMQLNTDVANNGGFPYIFPGALTDAQGTFPMAGQAFDGNALANIMTGALYLRSLGKNPQNYAAPVYRASRAHSLKKLDPLFRAFFNCLEAAVGPPM
jgi:RHS repeat-associated protein